MGSLGIIVGLYADKFDQMSTVTNFIIVPLSFLSGTFYSIDRLTEFLKVIKYGCLVEEKSVVFCTDQDITEPHLIISNERIYNLFKINIFC